MIVAKLAYLKTFDNFQPREGTEQAVEAVREFADHPQGWLVLTGGRGVGKTHLASAACAVWRANPLYWPWESANLLDFWRSRFEQGDFQIVFEAHCNAKVFALDDLGAEKPTEWAVERLTMFLNHRYSRQLPTLITTNYDEVTLAEKLNPRIADRVYDTGSGLCKIVSIEAESYRTGRAW